VSTGQDPFQMWAEDDDYADEGDYTATAPAGQVGGAELLAEQSRGRYGMSASAAAAYDALEGVNRPISLAIASLLGAAQGTAPADRWQHCADAIEDARRLLDQAAANLAQARPDRPAADEPA
jgi:hypothetical protein